MLCDAAYVKIVIYLSVKMPQTLCAFAATFRGVDCVGVKPLKRVILPQTAKDKGSAERQRNAFHMPEVLTVYAPS